MPLSLSLFLCLFLFLSVCIYCLFSAMDNANRQHVIYIFFLLARIKLLWKTHRYLRFYLSLSACACVGGGVYVCALYVHSVGYRVVILNDLLCIITIII